MPLEDLSTAVKLGVKQFFGSVTSRTPQSLPPRPAAQDQVPRNGAGFAAIPVAASDSGNVSKSVVRPFNANPMRYQRLKHLPESQGPPSRYGLAAHGFDNIFVINPLAGACDDLGKHSVA